MDQKMLSRLKRKQIYARLQGRSLRTFLLRKLITEYGYESKPRIAETLVDDILSCLDEAVPEGERVKPGQLVLLVVPVNLKGGVFGRPIEKTDLIPVVLNLVTKEDIEALADPNLSFEDRLKIRMRRLILEAHEQGGLLTQIELQAILGTRLGTIQRLLKELNREEGFLPTRGVIHDLGRTLTHKAEIVRLARAGYLSPEIARKTRHDIKSIDRYLKDYQKVRILATETEFSPEEIASLTGLSLSLVHQYLQIVKEQET